MAILALFYSTSPSSLSHSNESAGVIKNSMRPRHTSGTEQNLLVMPPIETETAANGQLMAS